MSSNCQKLGINHSYPNRALSNVVMEIFADPESEVDLKIMRACILGDAMRGIMRKTGIPEPTLKVHLHKLVKTRMLALNRASRYYFVTAKGERLLSVSESLG